MQGNNADQFERVLKAGWLCRLKRIEEFKREEHRKQIEWCDGVEGDDDEEGGGSGSGDAGDGDRGGGGGDDDNDACGEMISWYVLFCTATILLFLDSDGSRAFQTDRIIFQ
eukprot:2263036-Rhodomonas_salina.1